MHVFNFLGARMKDLALATWQSSFYSYAQTQNVLIIFIWFIAQSRNLFIYSFIQL